MTPIQFLIAFAVFATVMAHRATIGADRDADRFVELFPDHAAIAGTARWLNPYLCWLGAFVLWGKIFTRLVLS